MISMYTSSHWFVHARLLSSEGETVAARLGLALADAAERHLLHAVPCSPIACLHSPTRETHECRMCRSEPFYSCDGPGRHCAGSILTIDSASRAPVLRAVAGTAPVQTVPAFPQSRIIFLRMKWRSVPPRAAVRRLASFPAFTPPVFLVFAGCQHRTAASRPGNGARHWPFSGPWGRQAVLVKGPCSAKALMLAAALLAPPSLYLLLRQRLRQEKLVTIAPGAGTDVLASPQRRHHCL